MGVDIERFLESVNPYHNQGEVTNSDYVVLFLFCTFMPFVGWLLQMWFDEMSRGRPVPQVPCRCF